MRKMDWRSNEVVPRTHKHSAEDYQCQPCVTLLQSGTHSNSHSQGLTPWLLHPTLTIPTPCCLLASQLSVN